jgi:hypothetical protein
MMIEELKELTYIIVEIIKNQIRALMGKDFMSHLSSLAVPTVCSVVCSSPLLHHGVSSNQPEISSLTFFELIFFCFHTERNGR